MGLEDLSKYVMTFVVIGLLLGAGLVVLSKLVDRSVTLVGTPTAVANESWAAASNSTNKTLAHQYIKAGTIVVQNTTGNETLTSGNYTVWRTPGKAILTGTSSYFGQNLNISYTYYAQDKESTTATNATIIATGDFADWFGIIIVVLMAAVILGIVIAKFAPGRTV